MAAGLARLWQAALLIEHAPAAVSQAFVASRLRETGGMFGELGAGDDTAGVATPGVATPAILARAWPAIAAC